MIRTKGEVWGVTVDFSIRLKQPVPLGKEIRVIGRITRDSKRVFEGSGEILLSDNSLAVTGQGKYLKMDIEKITDFDADAEQWAVIREPNDPTRVDLQGTE
jgi:acyl-CoA thioesterase FadM